MKVKNVILVAVDALRYDTLGCNNPKLKKKINLTPNIDKLAGESVNFKRAVTQGPYTKVSFPALFFSNLINPNI